MTMATSFNAGDMVRLKNVAIDDVVVAQFGAAGVPAGQREYRIDGPLLATVIDEVPAGEFYAHLEWDADANGGPYEDEVEINSLVLVDPVDAHYLRLATEVDQIVGHSSFHAQLVLALWGDVTDMVEDYLLENGFEEGQTLRGIAESMRECRVENLLDDMSCDLHPHGRYISRTPLGFPVVSGC